MSSMNCILFSHLLPLITHFIVDMWIMARMISYCYFESNRSCDSSHGTWSTCYLRSFELNILSQRESNNYFIYSLNKYWKRAILQGDGDSVMLYKHSSGSWPFCFLIFSQSSLPCLLNFFDLLQHFFLLSSHIEIVLVNIGSKWESNTVEKDSEYPVCFIFAAKHFKPISINLRLLSSKKL